LAQELVNLGFPEDKIKFCRVNGKLECDIEDLFTEAEYLDAVNRVYAKVLKDARFIPIMAVAAKKHAIPALIRVVQIFESIWEDHKPQKWGKFDKKRVCDKLCELMYSDNKVIGEKTLQRFETLLKDIAEALKPVSVKLPETAEIAAQAPTGA
jgi:hypothetical protein